MNTTIQPIPEIDNLPEEKLEQLHAWLEQLSIRKTMAKLKDEWSLPITYNKLFRYRARHLSADQLSEHQDHALTMPEYLNLLNGCPVPYDVAGLALIQKRAFELAHAPNTSVSKLATLQRIFHYNTARIEADRKLKQTDRRNDIAERAVKVREEELVDRRASNSQGSTLNSQPAAQSDDLGPFARDWDEISERARIAFNVSKEEWARRQALHETYVDPNPDLNLNPNLSSPSADPAPPTEPDPLPERVNTYNIRRAEEYWAWRSHIASLPNGEPHPSFTTQHRHCPCGQVPSGTPCPEHENETYGEFPGWFWTISPHISAYARCLAHRNLPYRNPDECIPSEFIIS